jgi:hypothetical protein
VRENVFCLVIAELGMPHMPDLQGFRVNPQLRAHLPGMAKPGGTTSALTLIDISRALGDGWLSSLANVASGIVANASRDGFIPMLQEIKQPVLIESNCN